MRERLIRRLLGDDSAPADSRLPHHPRYPRDEHAWDWPTDDGLNETRLDAYVDGPAWDRPSEDEFAPPPVARELHWAFRTQAQDGRDGEGGERAVEDVEMHWAFRERARVSEDFDHRWTPEEGARLVTAARSDADQRPRDPAQVGIFDLHEAFAPALEERSSAPTSPVEPASPARELSLPSARPASPGRELSLPSAEPVPEPWSAAGAGAPARSVFGDFFAGRASSPVDRRGSSADSARPTSPPRDPLEWPPIPDAVLPPVPQPLGLDQMDDGAAPLPESDGRRFSWPPPQPRISATAAEPCVAPAPEAVAGQEPLWVAGPAPQVLARHQQRAAAARPGADRDAPAAA
ncbi:MAG TPA: hypothetical protein VK992_00715, partial [Candidatus Caenarcaniphilales bacterium]|nr:hypothetical protein [Candidatus Caenarcaniphilales bacterium]